MNSTYKRPQYGTVSIAHPFGISQNFSSPGRRGVSTIPDGDTKNNQHIFEVYDQKTLINIVYNFIKKRVNDIPGLSEEFGENEILQATVKVLFYISLLKDDIKSPNPRNDKSIHAFLKQVFSGHITEMLPPR